MTMPVFTMPFEPMTINHLGLRLYSTLPPVISELVSNAYDAESKRVEVMLPVGPIGPDAEVVVRDYGHGMDATELQGEYLPIGRNRRGSNSSEVMSKNGKVRVTGRKGLGKLSAFGVATEMEICSVKKGAAICLCINYDELIKWALEYAGKPYEPRVVAKRTGKSDQPDGMEVRLRKLHRKKAISADDLRRGLASRLTFIGTGFDVKVNGTAVKAEDRRRREDCQAGLVWEVDSVPNGGGIIAPGTAVTGWIGFVASASGALRGVDVFAAGKAVELGSFFNYPSTHAQFARAHICGSISADFLDDAGEDLIATARNSVVWESDVGQQLQEWGHKTLRWAFDQWVELRASHEEEKIIKVRGFDKWLESRNPREQRTARRLIRVLSKDPRLELDEENAEPILEIVKTSVETLAFQELLEALEADEDQVPRLIQLFSEWRVIEAREHLKLADGRLSVLEKLDRFIKTGALEVQEIQPLFQGNLWLLDPAWTEADVQPTYTKMLRDKCTEPKDWDDKDRRLDIFGVMSSGFATIVELKRPEKTLSRDDLEQIEKYVDFARAQFTGSGPDTPRYVNGLLLVGKLNPSDNVKTKIKRLAGDDIRVGTYGDLYHRSKRYYAEVETALKSVAPEYMRKRRGGS